MRLRSWLIAILTALPASVAAGQSLLYPHTVTNTYALPPIVKQYVHPVPYTVKNVFEQPVIHRNLYRPVATSVQNRIERTHYRQDNARYAMPVPAPMSSTAVQQQPTQPIVQIGTIKALRYLSPPQTQYYGQAISPLPNYVIVPSYSYQGLVR